jgi:outer membrane biosynthesis protein TonB
VSEPWEPPGGKHRGGLLGQWNRLGRWRGAVGVFGGLFAVLIVSGVVGAVSGGGTQDDAGTVSVVTTPTTSAAAPLVAAPTTPPPPTTSSSTVTSHKAIPAPRRTTATHRTPTPPKPTHRPTPTPTHRPKPRPKPKPAPPHYVHPGAFCSPAGAHGVTSKGTPMVCKGPGRNRWRHA